MSNAATAPGRRRWMAPLLAFGRVSFTKLLAYRLRYVVGIVNYVVYLAVQYFLWRAVYRSAPEGSSSLAATSGLDFSALVSYFAIGWIARISYFNNVDRELSERITSGDIALDLLRPQPLLLRYYGLAGGEALFRVLLMGLPTALVFYPLFEIEGPDLSGTTLDVVVRLSAFGLACAIAFHVYFFLNVLVGLLAVYFERIQGVLWAKFIVIQFLSGLMVPLDFLPVWGRRILEWLPFSAMAHGPASIYLGRMSTDRTLGLLSIQLAWVLALAGLSAWLWARCRRRLLVQGG